MTEGLGFVFWDGRRLEAAEFPGARRLGIDARCLAGDLEGWAHVCASADDRGKVPYDDPTAAQARREALAWWIPLLGDRLVCLSTFSVDSVYCAGAVTVLRDPGPMDHDPFARLFPATVVRVRGFAAVAPPTGPVVERYAGAPWPAGGF